ncbi:MAG: hypothetical protein KQ78_01998 [Candidatus Izimaplasma bacterium HR2]|nr:MAG: hypothetical protein KQ78_01998 [Candidatus Izimaplasma bacterium HR2]
MLTFEEFETYIKTIKNYSESDSKLDDILKSESFITYSYDAISAITKLLEHIMNDSETQWINYWLWELDFGKENYRMKIEENGVEIPLTTIRDLYNILIKFHKS